MVLRITRIFIIVLLAVLPYSTVLSSFSPYWNMAYSFGDYLIASLLFAIMNILLGWFVSSKTLFSNHGFFFFALGILTAPPFMIGPPETGLKLLERIPEEHLRYGLLMIAAIVFIVGMVSLLRRYWAEISFLNKPIVIVLAFCCVLLLWDNFSSYNLSTELKSWINEGNEAVDFSINYNFHEFWRTLGRSCIYLLTTWLSLILFKKGAIKKGQMVFLLSFSIVGIVFFFLTNSLGMQFYFPFMVPAIALAPAYWLGLMLISKKNPIP